MEQALYEKTVVDFAYDIISMEEEIELLRAENKRLREYEKKYTELLDSSIKHGEKMMGNILKATMNMTPDQISKAWG